MIRQYNYSMTAKLKQKKGMDKMRKTPLILGLALLAVLGLTSTAFAYMSSYSTGGFGMMGEYGMMGYGYTNNNNQVISSNQADDIMNKSLEKTTVDKTNNVISFNQPDVNLTLFGGPEGADGKFVAGGLVNPTIKVKKGSRVTLNFINEDEGMPHGIEVIASPPPYAYMTMMQGPVYPGAYVPVIPQAINGQYPNASATFVASQSGTFYYICQVPGHAAKGMYGEVIIQ